VGRPVLNLAEEDALSETSEVEERPLISPTPSFGAAVKEE